MISTLNSSALSFGGTSKNVGRQAYDNMLADNLRIAEAQNNVIVNDVQLPLFPAESNSKPQKLDVIA